MLIELTTGIAMLVSVFSGVGSVDTEIEANDPVVANQPITLEMHVREYFSDTPELAEVAKCESRFRHFKSNGKVLRGIENPDDVGVMQINEYYHLETSKKLGYDIHSVDGNMAYAKYIFEKQGLRPWKASSKCWSKSVKEIQLASSL